MKETIMIILWVLLIMLALLSLTFIVKNSENRGKTAIGVCIFITSMIILEGVHFRYEWINNLYYFGLGIIAYYPCKYIISNTFNK